MMNNNNINWYAMSDSAITESLGEFIKHHRLEQNKTQQQLAYESGINRTTLTLFENGKSGNLITFIQLLRSLNLLHVMDQFQIKMELSPLQLAKLDDDKRKRASKTKTPKPKTKSDW